MAKILKFGSATIAIAAAFAFVNIPVTAQLTPDSTLGGETSTLTPEGGRDLIEGGAIRGSNLFHSFLEFNINDGQQVYFANPNGIANILTRVTGKNASRILGTLGINGAANLFLVNPNGIIFGENARLDISGSFFASTANSVIFDNYSFSATNPKTPPLLTIKVPLGLQYGSNPGAIQVTGTGHNLTVKIPIFSPYQRDNNDSGLRVQPGNTLALVGGDVTISGGTLTAESGRIELGSVKDGFVGINPTAFGWNLDYSDVQNFGDIRLNSRALADVSGAGSGSIQVQARNLEMRDGSVLLIQNRSPLLSGNINVNASESVQLIGTTPDGAIRTGLHTQAVGGMGGDIALSTKRLDILGAAQIEAVTYSPATAGNITVNAAESTRVAGSSPVNPILLSAIVGTTYASGNGGNITLSTGQLTVEDGGTVTSVTFGSGNAGSVNVLANSIEVIGREQKSSLPSNINVSSFGEGRAGNLTIDTGSLIIQDGATIAAATASNGDAGSVTVNGSQFVEVSGNSSNISSSSSITSESIRKFFGLPDVPSGDAGNITINTPVFRVLNNGAINLRSDGIGKAGRLEVNADTIIVNNRGSIAATTVSNSGANIQLNTRRLQIDDGIINASTSGDGMGGNIIINAAESVEVIGVGVDYLQQNLIVPAFNGTVKLANYDVGIVNATAGGGAAGNIVIETPNFIARNGGLVATSTLGLGQGGNITINTIDTLEIDNSLLGTGTFTDARSGDLNLTARHLIAKGGALALTTSFSSGKAGNLTVNVSEAIDLTDPANVGQLLATGLFASSVQTASGQGGNITITTGDLNIRNGAAVSVSGQGFGNAGDINIFARSIFLDKGSIVATSIYGQGGNINLHISDSLNFRNNSQISTRAGTSDSGGGDGGNISIDTGILVALENSDINGNAFQGNGGNIEISSLGVYVFPDSQITASSQLGIDGVVKVNTPEVDPASGLVELPNTPQDPSDKIIAGCPASSGNRFSITGRGGLPDSPNQMLRSRELWRDRRDLFALSDRSREVSRRIDREKLPNDTGSEQIVEAQGWIMSSNGTIILTAQADRTSQLLSQRSQCLP
ncbi:filamentous hemagglutinin N-terminal domain-containing protein [Argonema galeatum]|uniref:two-partner secretion domain-containing protein n=1 Tax=Argonema galeatum TaxID=2942762 RepID=UPI002012E74E|nr:filamentous hemagglutinin N-terminal domain-containing protein [Argonema galeatum]MCL1467309.1 filamentous hemagglutinin N-terminal domain-containing protein [Argonema galeatum A003/A1]